MPLNPKVCDEAGPECIPLMVQVSLCYRPIIGGQEVYIDNLAQVLSRAGWATKVIQPYRGEKASDISTVFRIPAIARHIPFFDEFQFALFTIASKRALLDRADVILCHYASTASLIGRVKRWNRKTIVLSHGVEWNIDRMSAVDRVHEHNARRLFGRVITVANDTDYLRRMGMKVDPGSNMFSEVAPDVWFVPNSVDPQLFSHAGPTVPRTGKEHVILVPRQICEDRGILLAIEAFSVLASTRPDLRLVIVGQPREMNYFAECQRRVASYGLAGRVSFQQPVPNREMPDVYRNADITLIPSLRREGTSLSALESMACGVPVVATDVAGLRDLPAVLCEATPGAVAAGLETAMASRVELGQRQKDAVFKHFSYHVWADTWCRIACECRNRGLQ